MVDNAHHALLLEGVKSWNTWRTKTGESTEIDLSGIDLDSANLHGINLSHVNLTSANLSRTYLRDANLTGSNLSSARLCDASLPGASLNDATLTCANLDGAILVSADFTGADLSGARLTGIDFKNVNLMDANLSGVNLVETLHRDVNFSRLNMRGAVLRDSELAWIPLIATDLRGADLRGVDFTSADLTAADLSYADLSGANLMRARLLFANLTGANLTGACIEDWQVGSSTNLEKVNCDYIFRTNGEGTFSKRLPINSESCFALGEFGQRFQILESASETIDLTFERGLDWQAFFESFREVCSHHPSDNISVRAMERKGEAFVIQLETLSDTDRAAIESELKQTYSSRLAVLETQYEERLKLQGIQIEGARRTIEVEKQEKISLVEIIKTMAENQGPKYDMRGAQFAGGIAEIVQGDQVGGTINNYGAKLEDITQLLSTLREQAQTFPDEYRDNVLDTIDDLEMDIKKDSPDSNKIGRRLKRLVAAASAAGVIAGGAATFSSDMKDFASNVVELTEVLDLPIEFVQPHLPDK
ncbi:MAG: hypothetical protein DCF25_05855 [Leptolyngbya foveolarum]|uniref:Pentapeptide repeat-containing protein n=1 Tax=Leptolyngbya foveolarum TaxID=47253 RepID=A0A2W4UNR5_9CYAN|nr:MAG: hypothetical protein DCF25_05855 [Leptolyngbya foveolarum]